MELENIEQGPAVWRLVTPSLANLGPARLAEVVAAYRHQLRDLDGQAHHCCGWALEAIDTLLSDTLRLREELGHPASPAEQKRAGRIRE